MTPGLNTSKLGATVSPDGGKGVTAAVVYMPRIAIGGVREELEVQPWACAVVLATRCQEKNVLCWWFFSGTG